MKVLSSFEKYKYLVGSQENGHYLKGLKKDSRFYEIYVKIEFLYDLGLLLFHIHCNF